MGGNYLTLSEARQRQEEGLEAARASIPDLERDEVPIARGIKAIQSWVGDDPERAQRALDAELEKEPEHQRDSLVEWLQNKGAVSE